MKKRRKKEYILISVQVVFAIILIYSIYNIVVWFIENGKTQNMLNEINKFVSNEVITIENNNTTVPEEINVLRVDFNALKEINEDTIGYIKVNNTEINYPVVQTTNNDYYLNHSFNKTYNESGWIFSDYADVFDGTDKNIILFGHNRKDGSMFGSLNNTLNEEWYTNPENQVMKFVTPEGNFNYQIFSIYTTLNEEYYITSDFYNDKSFEDYIANMTNRSVYDFNIDVTTTDNLLTLSTCYSNGNTERLVIHGKLIK